MTTVVYQLLMGIGLAAGAGLRAFLPLLVVGVAARFDVIPLIDRLDWLRGDGALLVLGAAVVVEILADKVPVVDHLLDGVAMVVRPAAGAVAAAAPLTALDPMSSMVVGLMLGGAVAGGVHVSKSATRVASTASTAGIANPGLSLVEDAASLATSLMAVLVPMMAVALLVALTIAAAVVVRRRRTGARRRGAS